MAKSIWNNFCRNTFPLLYRSDDTTTVSRNDKETLFGSLFSSVSTLDNSYIAPFTDSPLTHPMYPIISFRTVQKVLLSLNTQIVWPRWHPSLCLKKKKNVLLNLRPCLLICFTLIQNQNVWCFLKTCIGAAPPSPFGSGSTLVKVSPSQAAPCCP